MRSLRLYVPALMALAFIFSSHPADARVKCSGTPSSNVARLEAYIRAFPTALKMSARIAWALDLGSRPIEIVARGYKKPHELWIAATRTDGVGHCIVFIVSNGAEARTLWLASPKGNFLRAARTRDKNNRRVKYAIVVREFKKVRNFLFKIAKEKAKEK